MKVLIYSQYWQKGGIEKLVTYMVDYFPAEYQFSIVTEDVPDPRNQYELPLNTPVYFQKFTPFSEPNKRKLRAFVESIDPDVVISMGSNRSLYKMSRACVDTPYPVIISEHNSDKEIRRSLYRDRDFLNAIRHSADLNHVLFESFASGYTNPENIRVITNPVLSSPLTNQFTKRNIIVNIARYHLEQKQQDVLVKAFSVIAKDYPDWKLHLYGGDWFGGKKEIQALVTKLGLDSQVVVNDSIDNVHEVLSVASIFAFPSAFEGFGLVAGEAMSVGLPVVAFADCEGVNQLVTNNYNGILVESHLKDSERFSEALKTLIDDESIRSTYSTNALNITNEFSLDKFISGWKDIIDEVALLKGHNKLSNLSEMEKHYMELVVSGMLFDKSYRSQPKYKLKNKVKMLARKYKLTKYLRAFYRRFK
ncbi:hypothetical protein A9264_15250 [Vibrio sp. UCD-FRSSP16_10]|uniref:glycosyltransferase n=1 Tax=unclassified Vibrio TaxID=2614977 RepID=UPI0007FDE0E0|nr:MULTISPECIES: glycosyltransferase [unclassified Vibrio]OBT13660.1 hypothetical protein A9260_13915 [Vibrio sp. UCD-FRSSP16_30]OBT19214.1 hypothetical protein A9264_15250 [Vibrio sp. UCD-FRSSP16_10]